MKTLKHRTKNILLTAVAGLMMFAFSSCVTKVDFLTSAVVPAAEGTVSIKADGNKNYDIKIHTKNLADSQNLTPPRNVYVVWLQSEDSGIKNIGQIISSTGSMSSKLKASFETVSSSKPMKIFITAENAANVQFHDSEVILTTDLIDL